MRREYYVDEDELERDTCRGCGELEYRCLCDTDYLFPYEHDCLYCGHPALPGRNCCSTACENLMYGLADSEARA